MSKPLQVYVDDGELRRLEAWARERGWSKSQAVRAAIRALVRSESAPQSSPLLSLSGMVLSGLHADASENFDRHLAQTYVSEGRASYQKAPKRRAGAKRRRA